MKTTISGYTITTDRSEMDIDFIHQFLTGSYWSEGINKEIVEKAIEGSLCFGVFKNKKQVGFARVVTDYATFAYLADVFIYPAHRGRGLSKWLMRVIIQHPGLQGLRRILLATKDAHGLYSKCGFKPLNNPERWMQIHNPDAYKH